MMAVAIICLILYSTWMSYNWVKEKAKAVELNEELRVSRGALLKEQENRAVEKSSFIARLDAKQNEIQDLKRYILDRLGKPDAVDFIVVRSKEDNDAGGKS